MAYPFPPDVARLVSERMAGGQYASEDDLLRDALSALEEAELLRLPTGASKIGSMADLRHEIQRGLQQLSRGEGRDADAVFGELLGDLPDPTAD